MANLEELEVLKKEALDKVAKIKEQDEDLFNKIADEIIDDIKEMKKKSDVSLNYEEDTVPVAAKDIATGLRNY